MDSDKEETIPFFPPYLCVEETSQKKKSKKRLDGQNISFY